MPAPAPRSRSIIKIAAQYLPSVIVPAAANILIVAIFGRRLGPSEMGQYYLALSIVGIGSILAGGWLQQSILRYESGRSLEAHQRLHLKFFAGVPALAMLFATVVYVLKAMGVTAVPLTWVIVLLVVSEAWYRLALGVLQSQSRSLTYSTTTSLFSLLRLATAIALYEAGHHDVRCLLYAWLIVQGTTCVTLFFALGYHRSLGSREVARPEKTIRDYVAYGLPMLGFMLLTELRPFTDRLVLLELLDSASVGVHGSNYAIGTNSIGLLATPLMLAVHPYLMGLANSENFDAREFREQTSKLSDLYLKLSTAILVAAVPSSHFVSWLVLGPSFEIGYPIFALSCFGSVIGGLAIYFAKGLEARDRSGSLLRCNIAAYVIAAVSALICVKLFGVVGASLGYVAGFVGYAGIAWAVTDKEVRPSLPIGPLCALASMFGISLFVATLVGASPLALVASTVAALAFMAVLFVRGDVARLRSIAGARAG